MTLIDYLSALSYEYVIRTLKQNIHRKSLKMTKVIIYKCISTCFKAFKGYG